MSEPYSPTTPVPVAQLAQLVNILAALQSVIAGGRIKTDGEFTIEQLGELVIEQVKLKNSAGTVIDPAQSSDVAAAAGLITSAMAPATTFAGGTKTVTLATTPEALVADSTPCKRVWIGPRVNADGVPQNTKPVFIGDTTGQNVPITVANLEGMVFSIDDAAKLFVKVGVDGEGVEYRIIA